MDRWGQTPDDRRGKRPARAGRNGSGGRRRLYWALNQNEEDIEHVHQLRVSTRRAGAALVIFRRLLAGQQFKRAVGNCARCAGPPARPGTGTFSLKIPRPGSRRPPIAIALASISARTRPWPAHVGPGPPCPGHAERRAGAGPAAGRHPRQPDSANASRLPGRPGQDHACPPGSRIWCVRRGRTCMLTNICTLSAFWANNYVMRWRFLYAVFRMTSAARPMPMWSTCKKCSARPR